MTDIAKTENKEETQVTEETQESKETQETESKSEAKEGKKRIPVKISDLMAKSEKKESKEETKSETQTEGEKKATAEEKDKENKEGKPPYKKSANERIQELNTRAKEADKRAEEAERKLEEALQKINGFEEKVTQLEKSLEGVALKKKEEEGRKIDFNKLREDLADKGWDDEEIDLYIENIEARMKAEKAISDLQSRLDAREQAEKEAEINEIREELYNHYTEMAKEYPHLFVDSDNGETPELKPEFDKIAMDIVNDTLVQTVIDGQTISYSPLLTTKAGIEMLIREVNRHYEANLKAKKRIDEERNLSKKTVENPTAQKPVKEKKRLSMSEWMEKV
jgi:hypothetical protein